MQVFYFFYHVFKRSIVINAIHLQPEAHDLLYRYVAEFDNAFQYIFFFQRRALVINLNCFIQLAQGSCLRLVGTTALPDAIGEGHHIYGNAAKEQVKGFYNSRSRIRKAQVVLCSPHLWQYACDQHYHKGNGNYFDQKIQVNGYNKMNNAKLQDGG